jgi:hypothetical protein
LTKRSKKLLLLRLYQLAFLSGCRDFSGQPAGAMEQIMNGAAVGLSILRPYAATH